MEGNNIELVAQMPAKGNTKSNVKQLAEQATKKSKPVYAIKKVKK